MREKQENVDVFVARMRGIISKLQSLKDFSENRALTEKEKRLVREAVALIKEDALLNDLSIQNHYVVPETYIKLRENITNSDNTTSLEMDIALAISLEKHALYALECKKLSKIEHDTTSIDFLTAWIDAKDAKHELLLALKDVMIEYYRQQIPANETSEERPVAGQELNNKTANATIARLNKRIQILTKGYEGAANLACEISRRGPKANGTPWTEPEVLALSDELGVTIKGDCLKAFKAGMPPELVKKDAGARPTTPREEYPDDVES